VRYSGLIYAAIVACWAAVLVPRWIRRNEEVEHAREEDAARGVRVIERERRTAGTASAGARRAHPAAHPGRPATSSTSSASSAEPLAEESGSQATTAPTEFGLAARRRRRVLTILLLALSGTVAGTLAGALASGWVAAAGGVLLVFLVVARRAAVAEARRQARMRQVARARAAHAEAAGSDERASMSADEHETGRPRKRVAVLDEPPPAEPIDPDAWEPVPVPLPTYLTKAKAVPPVARKIDLSSPGAWTSGRLNPASSVTLPPPKPALTVSEPDEGELSELPEHRRAVGD
jgi:hypothetical protein